MHGFKRWVAMGLLVLCGLQLVACKQNTGEGAALQWPLRAMPRSADPAMATSPAELLLARNCFESLLALDAKGQPKPAAAQSWVCSPDGRTYTFVLRADMAWHLSASAKAWLEAPFVEAFDPRVTAQDFVFGLVRTLLPQTESPNARALYPILGARQVHAGEWEPGRVGVQALDDFRLQITLEQPGDAILYTLAQPLASPCSQAFFDATQGRYGLGPRYLLGNGPFYWAYADDNSLRLRKNDAFNHPAALPRSVQAKLCPNPEEQLRLLGLDGGLDAAVVPAEGAQQNNNNSRLLKNRCTSLVFNCQKISDVALRKALVLALDVEQLGSTSRPAGFLPDGLLVAGQPFRALQGAAQFLPFDLAKAKAMLLQTQQPEASKTTELQVICAPAYEPLARRALQQWQSRFGLRVQPHLEVAEDWEERLQSGRFDLALVDLRVESSWALQSLQAFVQGSTQVARYQSAKVEDLLAKAALCADAKTLAKACAKVENHLLQNAVVLPLQQGADRLLFADGVQGIAVLPAGELVDFALAKRF